MRSACFFVTALFLTGCSNFSSVSPSASNPYAGHLYDGIKQLADKSHYDEQTSNIILAQAAVSVSQSLQELAKIQRSVNDITSVKEDPTLRNLKISGRTSLDWTGPVETLLAKIAKNAHCELSILGKKPALPVIVSISKKDASMADIIRDISYMVQNQAIVSYKNKTIELRYRS